MLYEARFYYKVSEALAESASQTCRQLMHLD